MRNSLRRDLRILKAYALISTLAFFAMTIAAFKTASHAQKFEEIDVERINIVEPDGSLRMVISNQERQHPGIMNGKVIQRDYPRPPGMIFFNQLGDEMGGLIFGANGDESHFGSLTFDKFRGDQTIGFRYLESDNGKYSTGLELWQQPNIPGDLLREKYDAIDTISNEQARNAAMQNLRDNNEITTRRLFLGKGRDEVSVLELCDIKGKPRIRLSVQAEGEAKIEFLDSSGTVISSLP